jgi:hypothetical protein
MTKEKNDPLEDAMEKCNKCLYTRCSKCVCEYRDIMEKEEFLKESFCDDGNPGRIKSLKYTRKIQMYGQGKKNE